MTYARVVRATLLLVLMTAPVQAALPPGYGGIVRLPADCILRAPEPYHARTPVEAAVHAAVFDSLYRVDPGPRIVPQLAAEMPEQDGDRWIVRLREGVRRHDRRPLRARDVVASLRRAARSERASFWLSSIARSEDGSLDVTATDEHTLSFASSGSPARMLAAAPLGIHVGRSRGTGAFRARVRGRNLELSQFRSAARGAPYLHSVELQSPRGREEELRDFELERVEGNFWGASLYGAPRREVGERPLPEVVPVLLVASERARRHLGAVLGALDRGRLARAGLRPSTRLHPSLPEPARLTGSAPSALRILVEDGDVLQEQLSRVLSARFDELGWRLEIQRVPHDRWAVALRSRWDLRIAQVVPGLPGPRALVAGAYAELGDTERAGAILRADDDAVAAAAEALGRRGAAVLGVRAMTLHHDATVRGVAFDPLGRLRFDDVFLPRAETVPGAAEARGR